MNCNQQWVVEAEAAEVPEIVPEEPAAEPNVGRKTASLQTVCLSVVFSVVAREVEQ